MNFTVIVVTDSSLVKFAKNRDKLVTIISLPILTDIFFSATSARSTEDQELFLTRQTDFYLCKSSDTHPLYLFTDDKVNTTANIVNLASSNLTIKPFKSLKGL